MHINQLMTSGEAMIQRSKLAIKSAAVLRGPRYAFLIYIWLMRLIANHLEAFPAASVTIAPTNLSAAFPFTKFTFATYAAFVIYYGGATAAASIDCPNANHSQGLSELASGRCIRRAHSTRPMSHLNTC